MAPLPRGVISRREMGTFECEVVVLPHRLGWGLTLLRGIHNISQWSIFSDYSSSVISAPSIICRHLINWSLFKCNCHYKSRIWHQYGNLGSMPTNNSKTSKLVSRTNHTTLTTVVVWKRIKLKLEAHCPKACWELIPPMPQHTTTFLCITFAKAKD